MKKLIFAAFALLFTFTAAMAQEGGMSSKPKKTPDQRAESFTKRMTKQLGLELAQQERVKGINLDRFKKLEEARATNAADRKAMASSVKTINDEYFTNMKGVLSADQFTKFQEMKEEIKDKAFKKRQEK